MVTIRVGLRNVRLQALIREESPSRISFEIASMGLEDRSRLRSLLITHLLAVGRRQQLSAKADFCAARRMEKAALTPTSRL